MLVYRLFCLDTGLWVLVKKIVLLRVVITYHILQVRTSKNTDDVCGEEQQNDNTKVNIFYLDLLVC